MYKSKLINLANFKDLEVKEEMYGGPMTDEEVETILQNKAKSKPNISQQDTIEKGDVVIMDLSSDVSKFNRKNLTLNVGLGMFDSQLEEEIIGMKKDEVNTLKLNQGSVEVSINSITRRSIPEITDSLVSSLDIDGVKTIKDYKEKLIEDDLRSKKMGTIPFASMMYVVENSEFDIKEEDLDAMAEMQIKSLEVEAEIIKRPVEDVVKEIYGIGKDELKAWFRNEAEMNLKQILIGIHFAEKNNAKLTDEIYEEEIKDNAAKMNLSIEDTRRIFPFELLYGNLYPLQAMNEIYEYYKQQYK